MNLLTSIYKSLSSLRLTIALLVAAMLLIFFGTLDQVHYGIYEVQKRYFGSWIAFWHYPKTWPASSVFSLIPLPLPGGISTGIILLLNLTLAHFRHFSLKLHKIGIWAIHLGLILLIVAGFLIGFFQEEMHMWLHLGQSSHFAENIHTTEIALIQKTPSHDFVTAIPQPLLLENSSIPIPNSSLSIHIKKFYPNADLGLRSQNPSAPPSLATQGFASRMDATLFPKPPSYNDQEPNSPAAYVEIFSNNHSLGTWLLSTILDDRFPPQLFTHNNHSYSIALRPQRTYFPFHFKLLQFKHENHPGTNIPSYFSSTIQVTENNKPNDPGRRVTIYMNHPLHLNGYTFFQASFGDNDKASMLQVVKNPIRSLPYIAISIIGLGLILHFLITLTRSLKRNNLPNHASPQS